MWRPGGSNEYRKMAPLCKGGWQKSSIFGWGIDWKRTEFTESVRELKVLTKQSLSQLR